MVAECMIEIKETILVVDKLNGISELVVEVLRADSFNVLQAESGVSALELARTYNGKIDLLLSNVEASGMTGAALGVAMKALRPCIHVMLMSAYFGGNLLILNYSWSCIEKSFVPAKLLAMVNSVLHTPIELQSTSQYDNRKGTDRSKWWNRPYRR